ncbi:1510_t:CDS:2 [Dentiscutata erythropus]|uniref:1510_t:CDS:1 n=1 Tax=Dentiscutata erythropus TaxID=1348616 RepID=A0A9N9A217_9GLOM|nr:1510_t:CDS:2 [Dentiscutata erythropus]
MCIPGPDCYECRGIDCFCIRSKPLTCNPITRTSPRKCINKKCGYDNTISNLSITEVTNLKRFITYSMISYCLNSATWKCGPLCDRIPQAVVVKTFTIKPNFWIQLFGSDAYAYTVITTNSNDQEIVVTFRGTADDRNKMKNFEFAQAPHGYASTSIPTSSDDVKVHYGFYSILAVVSLALLTALDIKQFFKEASSYLYTYSEPWVENSKFASFVNNNLNLILRVVNKAKLVLHLPPLIAGYEHHKGEVWIADPTNVVKCSDDENYSCSDSVPMPIMDDHFGPYWDISINTGLCK